MYSSLLKRKSFLADNSPAKKAALEKFDAGILAARKPTGTRSCVTSWIDIQNEMDRLPKLLGNQNLAALAVVTARGEKVEQLSLFCLDEEDDTMTVGHRGNNIHIAQPAAWKTVAILGNTLGFTNKTLAEEAGLIFLDKNLKVPVEKEAGAEDEAKSEPWDLTSKLPMLMKEDDYEPVLTIIPKALPIAWGSKPIPCASIKSDEVQTTAQENGELAYIWVDSMSALLEENEGKSLLAERSLEDILTFIPAGDRAKWQKTLGWSQEQEDKSICLQLLPRFNDSLGYRAVEERVDQLSTAAWTAFEHADAEARAAFMPKAGSSIKKTAVNLADAEDGYEESEKPKGKNKKHVLALRLLCMQRHELTKIVTIPEEEALNDTVVDMFKNTVELGTATDLHRQQVATLKSIKDLRLNNVLQQEGQPMMSTRFVYNMFKNSRWDTTHRFNTEADFTEVSPEPTLCAFHWAPQDPNSQEIKEIKQANATESTEILAGFSSKKQTTPSTKAHKSFNIATCQDLVTMIANKGLFMAFMFSKPGQPCKPEDWPMLALAAAQVIDSILDGAKATPDNNRDDDDTKWIKHINAEYPWLWLIVAGRWAAIVREFYVFATNADNIKKLDEGTLTNLDGHGSLITIREAIKGLCGEIRSARLQVSIGSLGFPYPPSYWRIACPTEWSQYRARLNPSVAGENSDKKNKGKEDKKEKDKNPKKGKKTKAGLLIFTGKKEPMAKDLDIPELKADANTDAKKICLRCTTKGLNECKFGKDCRFLNFGNGSDYKAFLQFPAEEQAKLDQWVEKHADFKYADGFGPGERPGNTATTGENA